MFLPFFILHEIKNIRYFKLEVSSCKSYYRNGGGIDCPSKGHRFEPRWTVVNPLGHQQLALILIERAVLTESGYYDALLNIPGIVFIQYR